MSVERQIELASRLADETNHEFDLCMAFMQDFNNNYTAAKKALVKLKL